MDGCRIRLMRDSAVTLSLLPQLFCGFLGGTFLTLGFVVLEVRFGGLGAWLVIASLGGLH